MDSIDECEPFEVVVIFHLVLKYPVDASFWRISAMHFGAPSANGDRHTFSDR
jgi:hypothetical protein